MRHIFCTVVASTLFTWCLWPAMATAQVPQCHDSEVSMELFAEAPQIVTPTGIAVDSTGRVFVAESHTHFRPEEYKGPATDRIVILEDTNNDGRADKRTVFHEGFTHVMDLKFSTDGWLYVATRMHVHRLRDSRGDGVADKVEPIVMMETTGTYPHNGISGLCFNSDGSLNFGLGENLGHDYTLIGTDGIRISGGGEGGSTYRVHADGSNLKRITTGWWNPFGMCVDSYGRIFGTDNDPGSSPPCRLIQIHDGADYGYEYRYGRTGLHPLISWTGELPGNIPMISGTGEAPCGIISATASNLPAPLRNDLLVACWADHQIERYRVSQPHDSGQVSVDRQVLVTGANNFRPVGLSIAPNGDIFVTDWVLASYQLHGKGRIWRLRGEPRAKTTAAPQPHANSQQEMIELIQASKDIEWQTMAVQQMTAANPALAEHFVDGSLPISVNAVAVPHLSLVTHSAEIESAARSSDPVLRHAAIQALARQAGTEQFSWLAKSLSPPILLAMKRSSLRDMFAKSDVLKTAIGSAENEVWTVAVKWIADDMLTDFRPDLMLQLQRDNLTVAQFLMLSAAIDRLDGQQPSDIPSDEQLAQTVINPTNNNTLKIAALKLLNPETQKLSLQQLLQLATSEEIALRRETLRHLGHRPETQAVQKIIEVASNETGSISERQTAIAVMATLQKQVTAVLMELAGNNSTEIATAALQSLAGGELNNSDRAQLQQLSQQQPELAELCDRVLGRKFPRPDQKDTDAWLKLVAETGNAEQGERVFFHTAIGTCGRCHQHNGRGNAVGPALSLIGRRLPQDERTAKRWLLETILQPSKDMAPQYTPWIVVTTDGRQLTGLPRRKGGTQEAYLGIDGKEFSVKKDQIEFHQESRTSIMPEGLLHNLTSQELADLFAFLMTSQ